MRLKNLLLCALLSVALPSLADTTVFDVDNIQLFQSGSEKYDALLQDMQSAQHHIHCEYFIFANDSIARRLLEVMRQKVKEGVECRLVVDGYYDRQRGYNYEKRLKQLRQQGIDVHLYEPFKFPFVHRVVRDHRKIVVIDGKIGYTGGFNVADYNIKGKPAYGAYVDTHVRLEGQAVEALQFLFSQHYEQVSGKGFDGGKYYPYTAANYVADGSTGVSIIERGRQCSAKKKEARVAVRRFIESSKDSLHITSPYLLPTLGVRRAIRKAIRRGVHVEILFSEGGDTPIFDAGNLSYANHLQKQGAEVWLYGEAFQHSKIMMADGEKCMVGSVNLDYRALRLNEEVAAIIYDSDATQWLDSAFVQNQQSSHLLTTGYYKNLPFSTRIKGFFANYLLSWCL